MSHGNGQGVKSMSDHGANEVKLFWACFIALIATAFGFTIRAQVLDQLGVDFNLDATQKGALNGVALWPFAISIVLFSLVIDKIGYGKAMVFAFVAHAASATMIILSKGMNNYQMLYWGMFVGALANGTVEAVINPVVATMFPKEKTKWLNILHAGWPGGMVIAGIVVWLMGDVDWRIKFALIYIPVIVYGIMMIGKKFPIHERVLAGISYREMLGEAGIVSAFIVTALIVRELGKNVFGIPDVAQIAVIVALVGAYGAYVRSLGRPMFIFLVLLMIPLATTELGTDSWISDLMIPVMQGNAILVLVYTSFIMMVLRFFAGPIVHRISPLGLLAASAAIATLGLVFLSQATGIAILVAATLYAFGKTFFWPTTLGVVAEQFPKGGALTMNLIAGVGMLGVGIVGSVFIGNVQDRVGNSHLAAENATLHQQVTAEKDSVFGKYVSIDTELVAAASPEARAEIAQIQADSKKTALLWIAALPALMLVCYLALIVYFRGQGGYKAVELPQGGEPKREPEKMTGGVEAAVR